MIVSMTGFASKTLIITNKEGSQAQLTLSLKSLNSRYFEASCKIPTALSNLETDLIKLLKKKLHRGYVVLLVQVSNPNLFKGNVQADLATTKSYINAIQQIQKEYDISGSIDLHNILSLPNVFVAEEKSIDEEIKTKILNAVQSVTDELIVTRSLEGEALQKDLNKRIALMEQNIHDIEKIFDVIMKQKKEEVSRHLTELPVNAQDVSDMQRATLYLELDKMDIHEEIVRFNNHLVTFKKAITSSDEEKGRRLDFILQELARETNTIAAKCGDSQISTHAINLKVEVEKAREQVQNIV